MEENDLLALLADIERRRSLARADMERIARFERTLMLCVGMAGFFLSFSLGWLLLTAAWGMYAR
jgi:hypothetical protein